MCISIIGPLGVPLQLYASALAGGGPWLPEYGAPARTVKPKLRMLALGFPRGPAYRAPLPLASSPGRGFPRGPLIWRLCRVSSPGRGARVPESRWRGGRGEALPVKGAQH